LLLFDPDPDPGVSFEFVTQTAFALRECSGKRDARAGPMGRPADLSSVSDAELDAKIEALAVINKANRGKQANQAA
jgi:hypothetical protein